MQPEHLLCTDYTSYAFSSPHDIRWPKETVPRLGSAQSSQFSVVLYLSSVQGHSGCKDDAGRQLRNDACDRQPCKWDGGQDSSSNHRK